MHSKFGSHSCNGNFGRHILKNVKNGHIVKLRIAAQGQSTVEGST